jgi:hypothetical protein
LLYTHPGAVGSGYYSFFNPETRVYAHMLSKAVYSLSGDRVFFSNGAPSVVDTRSAPKVGFYTTHGRHNIKTR